MKRKSTVSANRVSDSLRQQYSPLRGFNPASLTRDLEAFERGDFRRSARLFDYIERRDDTLRSVVPKRKGALARYKWQVETLEDSAQAERQKEQLEYTLNNLTATLAMKPNVKSGWKGLVKILMDARGKGYSASELIWNPTKNGLKVEVQHVPLWFFEAREGPLRYLERDSEVHGSDLSEGQWLVGADEDGGLMTACAIAYLYKILPLKDWLIYSEKFGMPWPIGKSSHDQYTKEWNAMVDAVSNLMVDGCAVISNGDEIQLVNTGSQGQPPQAILVERCERVMARLWRGGDLSTISGNKSHAGQGASLQDDEKRILEEDDQTYIEDTLNCNFVPWAVRFATGDSDPLVKISIPLPDGENSQQAQSTDKFFIDNGLPLGVRDVYARHGRRRPDDDDEVVGGKSETAPSAEEPGQEEVPAVEPTVEQTEEVLPEEEDALDNEQVTVTRPAPSDPAPDHELARSAEEVREDFVEEGLARYEADRRENLAPLAALLALALETEDDEERNALLVELNEGLPEYLNNVAAEEALNDFFTTALVNGLAGGDFQNEEGGQS